MTLNTPEVGGQPGSEAFPSTTIIFFVELMTLHIWTLAIASYTEDPNWSPKESPKDLFLSFVGKAASLASL